MVKFNDFSRPWNIFKNFSKQIEFSMTFQDSLLHSSTFQACANPELSVSLQSDLGPLVPPPPLSLDPPMCLNQKGISVKKCKDFDFSLHTGTFFIFFFLLSSDLFQN